MATDEDILNAYNSAGGMRAAARLLDVHHSTIARRMAKIHGDAEFTTPDIAEPERTIEQLLQDRKAEFGRVDDHEQRHGLREISVLLDGPIGILHVGDPHLDDPGCDISSIERDLTIVRDTRGMFAGNVGDMVNNWIGRLARLYATQTTTAREAWMLVEWMMGLCAGKWLYVTGGNHDAWSGPGDPLRYIARQHNAPLRYHGARLALRFPNKREIRINTRHDHRGNSMWNPTHGGAKAAQIGTRDHIYTCGHLHNSAHQRIPLPDRVREPIVADVIRLGSYKRHDDYARAGGFEDRPMAPSCVTIINPAETNPWCVTRVEYDVEFAAEYLGWLRNRKQRAKA